MDLNDLTYKINGAVFEVNSVLGPGFLEKVYENAIVVELNQIGLRVQAQAPIKVGYKGKCIGEYFTDLLVEGKVIVELKTVERLTGLHEAQLLNYLKASEIRIGLLVNFWHPKAQIKRIVKDL